MGLGKTLIVVGVTAWVGISYAGIRDYVDSRAGNGTFNSAVSFGTHGANQTAAEIPTAANDFVTVNKKPIGDLLHQGTSALGSVTGGSTATSAPGTRTDEGDGTTAGDAQ